MQQLMPENAHRHCMTTVS